MDKDLTKLLNMPWRISDRNAEPGVWLVLNTATMGVTERDEAYSLLSKQGIESEW